MKTITIGRDTSCNIVIDDPMISRRHALLRIYPWGKMELVDLSQNGTYVNGIRLSNNVSFPVQRKNAVSFAHVKQLDWSSVPDPLRFFKYTLYITLFLIILAISFFAIKSCHRPLEVIPETIENPIVNPEEGSMKPIVNPEEGSMKTSPVQSTDSVEKKEKNKNWVDQYIKENTPKSKRSNTSTKNKKKEEQKGEDNKESDKKSSSMNIIF